MVLRIIRKINFLALQAGIDSFSQLKKKESCNQLNSKTIEESKDIIRPYYEQYIKEVSKPDMAASLELVAFLYTLCKLKQFTKLLDMGSGLSSFAFRFYAKGNPEIKVFSVDDDVAWLEKTKEFLNQHQLNTQNMFTLEQFLVSGESGFDCILHDLNFVDVRINYVERIVDIAKANGVIIFDDVHKSDYLFALLTKLKAKTVKMYNLKPITLDQYKRFAMAAVKD